LDTGNIQPFILQLRQEVARGRLPGPRIYCAGALVDSPDPVWPAISVSVCSIEQVPRIVEQLKNDGVDILIINGRPDRTIGDSRTIEMIIQAGRIVNRDKLRYDVNTEAGFQVFSPDAWKKK